jgi:stearoyl-CoA desaturase (delta-9 desaturase)
MTGLLDLVYQHDLRDHWQNQRRAPAVYAYRHSLWTDFVWYLHCRWTPRPDAPAGLHYAPPRRADIHDVPFYAWLQRTWRLQQLGLAVVLFGVGGWPWVVWGVLGRLAITRTGFWLVNYLAHTHGTLAHPIAGSCEQGRNNAWFGLVSFGEAWHNNHHAWPSSAQVGVEPWQVDPAWRFIQLLERLGLAWDVKDVTSTLKRPCEGAARRSVRRGHAAARRPAHW